MSQTDLARLRAQFPAGVHETHSEKGDDTAVVERAELGAICRFLRDQPELGFDMLSDLTAVDYLPRQPRFEVVLHLRSVARGKRLRLKVRLGEDDPTVDSLTSVWPAADWLERECYDMFGIVFTGHPDLRRLLMYEEFVGHPLRKDYQKERRQPLIRRREIA
jgi:NADH-quinone oxidoreductase subunit C